MKAKLPSKKTTTTTTTKKVAPIKAKLLSRTIINVETSHVHRTNESTGIVSMTLTLDDGRKIYISTGVRGATEYDRDTISVYEID